MPDIITPKLITPTDFAYCYFLNASTSFDNLIIESNSVNVFKGLEFQNIYKDYNKVNSGDSYIRILSADNKSTLLNLPAKFSKGLYYTFIPYGSGSALKVLMLKDSLLKLGNESSMIRFINISQDVPSATFELISKSTITNEIQIKSASGIQIIDVGKFDIKVKIGSDVKFDFKNIQINPAKLYNIVLKGKSSSSDSKKLTCQICEVTLP